MEIKSDFRISRKSNNLSEYILDFGELKKGVSKQAIVTFSSDSKITNPFATVSCSSCTKAKINQRTENTFELSINYTGKSLGNFSKNVRVYLEVNSKKSLYTITIVGEVKR